MFSDVIKLVVRITIDGGGRGFSRETAVTESNSISNILSCTLSKTILLKGVLFCFIALLTLHLAGCSATYAPVEQRSATAYKNKTKYTGNPPLYYKVKKGDTLYFIAWLYGLDFKSLAKNNKITPPYRIYAGQKLRLRPYSSKNTQSRKKSQKKTKVVSSKRRNKPVSKSSKAVKKSTVKKSTAKKSTAKKSTVKTKKRASAIQTVKNKTKSSTGNKKLNWAWPVKGKVIQRYSPARGKKGIDISASRGALVKSSEAGKVVYSGQGLVGYGRLIIIKHDDNYLSAYAHNQHLLVNEGQMVKKGQTIARLGRSGTDRYKLHFEIRKKGKPVNPLNYLPR